MPGKGYLCFVDKNFAYFYDGGIEDLRLRNWDRSPYQYSHPEKPSGEKISRIAFDDWDFLQPPHFGEFSVLSVNNSCVAWLTRILGPGEYLQIYAGTEYNKFIDMVHGCDCDLWVEVEKRNKR